MSSKTSFSQQILHKKFYVFVKFICFFQKYVTVISQGGFTEMNFVAMDFETANHQPYSACSLALVMVKNSQIVDEFYTLIQPETPFSGEMSKFTESIKKTYAMRRNSQKSGKLSNHIFKKIV